jgi:large subunit ribosomal protein L11
VEISVYDDRSYTFIIKTSPASRLILKAIGKDKGALKPGSQKMDAITMDQVRQIAEKKMPDLNAATIEGAMKTIAGTARSMGIKVKD